MTRGKIVLVPFPFDDLSAAKVRPAVCLTEPIGPHRHVILAFISSRIPTDLLETDLVLDSGQADDEAVNEALRLLIRIAKTQAVRST
jgi:mRNA interferase MazF